jgi:hypothetical protein
MMLMTTATLLLIKYYAAVDQDLHKWFEGLRSGSGGYCCAETDGVKVEDPEWGRTDAGGYWVAIKGARVEVPPEAVIHAKNPKVGFAMVWNQSTDGKPKILCFLPGIET